MTTELDERLGDFVDFLRRSLAASEPKEKSTLVVSGFGSSVEPKMRSSSLWTRIREHFSELFSTIGLIVAVGGIVTRASIGGLDISFDRERRLIGAPISDPRFAETAVVAITRIKALIKDVTLGTASPPLTRNGRR